jgi:hypothetical protein
MPHPHPKPPPPEGCIRLTLAAAERRATSWRPFAHSHRIVAVVQEMCFAATRSTRWRSRGPISFPCISISHLRDAPHHHMHAYPTLVLGAASLADTGSLHTGSAQAFAETN